MDYEHEIKNLRRDVRRLLHSSCRQREKVPGILRSILPGLYPEDEIGELRKLIEIEFTETINGNGRNQIDDL